MSKPEPWIRESGTGPGIVCLHSNASHSGQWRALMSRLSDRYHVLAPDSYGSGQSPEWPSDTIITLADEVALLEPVLGKAGSPFILVGHSYGAAIALRAALTYPDRVRALVLYEPTLFSLIDAEGRSPNEADGIRDTVASAAAALEAGDRDRAAKAFIDYWMGEGSWDNTRADRKPAIADSVLNVRRWAHALLTEPTPLSAFCNLRVPVLLMTGGRSTRSAHGVARRLLTVLPLAEHREFPELGHMAPITHPEPVNQAIEEFVLRMS
ncbi:alpha/beta fold hydrolase [Lacisediminimonas profundi]|uniref:alpha/beta fold hydrolase n=1 Tax=Lacisediminimonas profundi TaxID=2603856 RepID=UPI00124B859F|nr:alpha/beta hydrolase [Lacisediminimonas profundi]